MTQNADSGRVIDAVLAALYATEETPEMPNWDRAWMMVEHLLEHGWTLTPNAAREPDANYHDGDCPACGNELGSAAAICELCADHAS
jgi:hypothetical protein